MFGELELGRQQLYSVNASVLDKKKAGIFFVYLTVSEFEAGMKRVILTVGTTGVMEGHRTMADRQFEPCQAGKPDVG